MDKRLSSHSGGVRFLAFCTIKEQYWQIFVISHESEMREMFERVVELLKKIYKGNIG